MPPLAAHDYTTDAQGASLLLRALLPRVEAGDAEWFEVSGVACRDGLVCGLGDGGERVIERGVFRDSVGSQDPRGG
jgi:hypothetical protein